MHVATGVARPDVGAPPVYLAVEGFLQLESPAEAAGCVETRTCVRGSSPTFPSTAAAASGLAVEATVSASTACPAERVPLRGTILGPDGSTLDAAFATVTVVAPGNGESLGLDVASDGSFEHGLPAWGTFEAPAIVTLEYVSLPTRSSRSASDCLRTFAQRRRLGGRAGAGRGRGAAGRSSW